MTATTPRVQMKPDREVLGQMYRAAALVKLCDTRFRSMLQAGQTKHMYYSPRGQECIPAAMSANLRATDYLVTTYRGVHDQLAKGIPLRRLWAEYLGKSTGSCKGKGGPMHITDTSVGIMVTTGVVGSGLPIANGFGLAAQLRGTDDVTVVNFGDGASNIGAFHEALNLASIWRLPVIFVCQNNLYAEYTPYAGGTAVDHISQRGASYRIPAETVNGNDMLEMYWTAKRAVDRARAGDGPTLIEAMTYRFYGHNWGDSMAYMPRAEREAARKADPVEAYRRLLIEELDFTDADLAIVDSEILAQIDDAVSYALSQPDPDRSELYLDVYAEEVTPS